MAINESEESNTGRWSLHGRFDSETERRIRLLSEVYGFIGLETTTARWAAIHDLVSLGVASISDLPSTQATSPSMIEPALAASGWQSCW